MELVLDGTPGVVPDLVPGIQGWKNPGSLGKTWDQSKSLKFILIDSNFLLFPVLRPPVTLVFPQSFRRIFSFFKRSFSKNTLQGFPGVRKVWEEQSPSYLPRSLCTEKERKRERKGEKTERKQCFFYFFEKKRTPAKIKNKIK